MQQQPYDYRKGLKECLKIRKEIENLNKRRAEAEEALKAYMHWAGYDTLEVGSHKAVLRRLLVQSIDTARLREEDMETATRYTVTREQERLTLR